MSRERSAGARPPWPRRLVTAPIVAYRRFLSPLKPAPSCRFHPTCSAYAVEAVHAHGVLRGLALAVWRVLRCHPFHPGGFDPVPPAAAPRGAGRRRPDGTAFAHLPGPAPEEPS